MSSPPSDPGSPPPSGERAVVVGAGFGGLLAAAALSKRFAEVVVVERDGPPDARRARKGAPQGAHIHLLLIRGSQAIESILPGIFEEISSDGGLAADSTRDLAFFHFGAWQPRGFAALPARLQTRPFLEWHVTRRVEELANVRLLRRHEVRALRVADGCLRSVVVAPRGEGPEFDIPANLVVDAAGRASLTPRWLAELGYPTPETSEVALQITYVSRLFQAPAGASTEDWRAMLVYPQAPGEFRGGALYFQEGDRWIVTMASYRGEPPPRDDASFLEFAASLPSAEIHRLIRNAKPVSPIATFRYPGALRRHYERLSRRPKGLIVLGDAVCSFNPVFGQGMTSAALQVEALSACLARNSSEGLEKRFARAAADVCDTPWLLSTTMDLRYPHARGRRAFWQPVLEAYLGRFFKATAHDYPALLDFMRVLHQVSPPTRLARPRNLLAVLRSALGGARGVSEKRPPLTSYAASGEAEAD